MKLNAFSTGMPKPWPKKITLIMKFTTLIMFVALLQCSAKGYSQKVNLDETNAPLKKVLQQINKQTGYVFFYDSKDVKNKNVSVQLKDASLNDALNSCLKDQALSYKIVDKTVVLQQADESRTISVTAAHAAITVTGQVSDDKKAPLAGVTIRIKGTTKAVVSDANGKYSITVPDNNAVLVFLYIGYTTKEVPVSTGTTINVVLSESINNLNEVTVTGSFGIKRQEKALGYATSTVTSKQITEAGNTNFASALYGKAAGVIVRTQPGGASSAVSVQIRGINSIGYNQPPLYVVDGVIIRNQQQYGVAGGFNNNGFYSDQRIEGNGILDINPSDIETINILKGGAATALYGSDAEGGVIVITTKKGVKGRGPTVDFNYYGTEEQAAFLPNYQNVYGQGYDRATNLSLGFNADGSVPDANSPSGWRPCVVPRRGFPAWFRRVFRLRNPWCGA